MPTLGDTISGFVQGNDLELDCPVKNIPTGQTLVEAWLTIKIKITDTDPGILQKVINLTDQPGIGQITDDGGGTAPGGVIGVGQLRFDLTPTDTAILVGGTKYFYDIKVKTSLSKYYTTDSGTIVSTGWVTRSQ